MKHLYDMVIHKKNENGEPILTKDGKKIWRTVGKMFQSEDGNVFGMFEMFDKDVKFTCFPPKPREEKKDMDVPFD